MTSSLLKETSSFFLLHYNTTAAFYFIYIKNIDYANIMITIFYKLLIIVSLVVYDVVISQKYMGMYCFNKIHN